MRNANYFCFVTQRIILGGGVMKQVHLFPMIRQKLKEKLNGYIDNFTMNHLESTIVPVSLGENSGVMGALALAKMAYLEYENKQLESSL